MTDYIDIGDTEDNNDNDIVLEPIYQLQPNDNTNKFKILNVGEFEKPSDVIINRFDMDTNIHCIMASCIYDEESLKECQTECIFPIIKIVITYDDGRLIPIGNIQYNVHTFSHIKNKNDITDHLSSKDTIILLDGFFSITFHYTYKDEHKYTYLDKYQTYTNSKTMFDDTVKSLKNDKVVEIIKILINDIQ